ncbi:MAG: phage tail tape measure protein, partial [Hyphomicrobiales bacterium]|nr:phage tail tape measure protein [Hyphomicrobiales bacterium]
MVDAVKTIGIGIDPRGSKTGARVVKAELQGIGRAADKAEKEVRELGRGGSAALKQVGTSAAAARPGITSLTGSVKGLAATFISVAAAARLVTGSINQSLDFSKAIGEVGTLGQDMDATAAKAREFAKTFGTDAAGQVKAFYQTFSAGASTLAEASTTLEAANKLAIGGATDVTTAVDGLTSIMNAYGDAAGSATDVSDTLFVAMKAGKTTIEELSSSLGRVTPLAAAAGVSFDEVAAAVAALTKGGITTRQAVTSLQQTISNIIKPSSEAAKEANRLGIEFNAAALKAQGFQGFMESTIEAAGGNVESLGKLFGSVEALTGVMALAGQAGLDFSDILDDMKNKAGSTEQAFETMSDSFDRKWSIAVAKAQDIGLTFGDALLTVLVPAMTLLADNIDLVISGFSALSVFWVTSKIVAFAGAIGSASVAAGGFAAALGAIAWPVAAAAATAAAIISIISAYNDAAEKAEVYRDLQNQVNEALGISETASKSAANAIEQKGISDLQAAQSLLKL